MREFKVGLSVGGLMECSDFTYQDVQVIEAETPRDAEIKYNELNKCSYFYGKCLGEVNYD